jgi:hypothetical protein
MMRVPAVVFLAREEHSAVLYASQQTMTIIAMQIVTTLITMLTMMIARLILKDVNDGSFTRTVASKIDLSYAFQGEGATFKIC